jgi:hypothetical protein
MPTRIPLTLVLWGFVIPLGAAAADVSKDSGELAEVDVIGKSLHELEREVIVAEDRFYKRFNTLNTNDDFDIHCRMEEMTGTRVPQRQCRIKFLADAQAMDSQEFLKGLTSASGASGMNTPVAALMPQWVQRRDEYRQTAKALLEKDPELLALANEWLRLHEQYDRVRKERQKGRIIVF